MRGPQEFIDTVINIREAFSDLHYEEQMTISSEDKVVTIVTVSGKHTGSFFGFIPPSGNKISYQAVPYSYHQWGWKDCRTQSHS